MLRASYLIVGFAYSMAQKGGKSGLRNQHFIYFLKPKEYTIKLHEDIFSFISQPVTWKNDLDLFKLELENQSI